MKNEKILVEGNLTSIRLDRFLRDKYKKLPQSFIEKNLRLGNIRLDGKKAKSNIHVVNGNEISFRNIDLNIFLPENFNFHTKDSKDLAKKLLTSLKLYEDDNILIINKQDGMPVQGGSKVRLSIDDALKYLNSLGGNFKIVHRLDKDTSGVLIIAKSKSAASIVSKAFREKIIIKKYLAILEGVPTKNHGEIISKIAKSDSKHFQKIEEDDEKGKVSISHYRVLEAKGGFSLIEFIPETGRMHQLRVHAKSLGCPIVGDPKYNETNNNADRLYLHAFQIILPVQILGYHIEVTAPAPVDFKKYLFVKLPKEV